MHVVLHPLGSGHGDVKQLPQAAIGCRGHERFVMVIAQRLETDAASTPRGGYFETRHGSGTFVSTELLYTCPQCRRAVAVVRTTRG